MNILEERFETYLASMGQKLEPSLEALYEKGTKEKIPMIGTGVQQFLMVLMELAQPKRILEIGTAHAFSAILMATYNPALEELITIENYKKRIPVAKANISESGFGNKIHLVSGDANQILPTLEGPFDFIFMDAAKGQYEVIWPIVRELIRPGGMILTDDCLQNGDVLESRFAIRRRDRTIHKRMREFLYEQMHDTDFTGTILSMDDGVSLVVRKQEV